MAVIANNWQILVSVFNNSPVSISQPFRTENPTSAHFLAGFVLVHPKFPSLLFHPVTDLLESADRKEIN